MRKIRFAAALLLPTMPILSHADTITQTVAFDYDANFGVTFPVIQGFDTQGGTRELVGVSLAFDQHLSADLYFESTGPTAVADGDFLLSFAYPTLFQLGPADDENPPPLIGPGAFFVGDISGPLGAFDGVPGNDGHDSFRTTITDAFQLQFDYTAADPEVLAALTTSGPLTTVFGGFTELFFSWVNDPGWPVPPGGFPEYPTDAALWVSWSNFRHFGEITVTYDYAAVPEPTSGVLLCAGAVAMLARRFR